MSGDSRGRLAAAVALVGVAALAVASRQAGGLDAGAANGLWRAGRPAVAILAVIALVAIATTFAKHRDNGYGVLHRAGTATALLLTAAAVLTPIGLLFFGRRATTGKPPVADYRPVPGKPSSSSGQSGRLAPEKKTHGLELAHWIGQLVLALVVVAAVALVAYVTIRLLARLRLSAKPIAGIEFEPLGPEVDQLAEAVAAGTEALEYAGDAREAVIACYSAMEQAVSAGGGGRRATDTPEDFLRRVTAAGLAPEEPARRLTDLFREARFSRHPIAEEQRDAAREALLAISGHLRGRAEQLAAEQARQQAHQQAQQQARAEADAASPATGRPR